MATTKHGLNLLQKWFPHTTAPFIANAAMYGYANVELAVAVSRARGFGFIGGAFDFSAQSRQLQDLDAELSKARSLLDIASLDERLPLGVGFITFKPGGFAENAVPILLKHRVAGIWLAFPRSGADHAPMISAIRETREREGWDVKVFVQVGTVRAAKEAVGQGVDVLVVQGVDAGGHQWAQGASAVVLVPEVKDLLSDMGKVEEVAVVAAGGIVDGRGCVAALGLGADGIVMGTRFLATTECPAPSSTKQTLLSITDGATSTIKSRHHDVFQSTDFWPPEYDGRAVIGRSYEDFEKGMSDEENIERYKKALEKGDSERRIVWAGAALGSIKEIVPAGDLVKNTQREAKQVRERMTSAF